MTGQLAFVPVNVGKWWAANEKVDLVVLGETEAVLVECKWTDKPAGIDLLVDLERKADLMKPDLERRSIHCAMCSRSGFTSQLEENARQRKDIILRNLPDILDQAKR